MIPKFALNEKFLDGYAELYEWVKVEVPNNANYMVSYRKDDIRLNFWLTTATVGSYLYHPKKKHKTQLFRRSITMDEAEGLFINPRRHTGKGYHETKELLPMDEIVRKRGRHYEEEGGEGGEEVDHEELARPLKRSRISCQFGANCEREDCSYEHRCRYGNDCTREDCIYDHSEGASTWWYDELCRYGTDCSRGDCKFQHPYGKRENVPCRYGSRCTRHECWYEH